MLVCLMLVLALGRMEVEAAEAEHLNTVVEAAEISNLSRLTDGNRASYLNLSEENVLTVKREDGIAGLYLEFDRVPSPWELSCGEEIITCGTNGFLHEYVDVKALFGSMVEEVELTFPTGTVLSEVYGFSDGELPDWVQTWAPPHEKADLLLLTTHSDDEQLFFLGMLPYYTMERNLRVQVAYGVQHFEADGVQNHTRPHEQLDGLWTVGVRHYPVMSDFPDLYAESKDRQVALDNAKTVFAKAGVEYQDVMDYVTTIIRRFQPLVVVSHDLNGEYGHGAHVLMVEALTEALVAAADESVSIKAEQTTSADEVGDDLQTKDTDYAPWQVEKTYLHLYPENTIVMDYDTPYESMGGRTAFEVSQEGFGCHKSQHWTWFNRWMNGTPEAPITKASQIKTYSPCKYGLYQTTVGTDVVGGDFFENIKTYDVREEEARIAAEEAAKKAEEEARLEAIRKAEEEARIAAEEARLLAEAKRKELFTILGSVGGVVLVIGVAVVCVFKRKKKHGETDS